MADDDIRMSRRNLFRRIKKGPGQALDELANGKILSRQRIRPPGALAEEEFLKTCTRCSVCIDVCPESALKPVPIEGGARDGETPYLDPYSTACAYCQDFPCIQQCEPKALFVEEGELVPPIGKAVFHAEHCLWNQGQICDNYCIRSCPKDIKALRKVPSGIEVDSSTCIGCGQCAYICVSMTGKALSISPV